MAIHIRPMVAADYAPLRALDDAVMRYSARTFLGFDWDSAPPEKREEQRAITPDAFAFYAGTGSSLVAEVDGAIAGYVLAQQLQHFDLEPLAVWVEDISVHPDHHRRGIATALYQHLAAQARAAGATVILAGIHRDNAPSLAVHQRVGFDIYTTKTAVWRLE
jgi:L-amino acid N-acyltransferase YncA